MGINEYIKIGEKMKQERIEHGLSQKEMAEKLHLSVSTYSNYENGHREPTLEIVNNFCEILKITIEDLIGSSITLIQRTRRRKVISEEQNTILRKYRCLDDHGKALINTILNKELERCATTETAQFYLHAAQLRDSSINNILDAFDILSNEYVNADYLNQIDPEVF